MNSSIRHNETPACEASATSHTALPPPLCPEGNQRLSLSQLKTWESWGFGMFIHFGMSTFVGEELPSGKQPASLYAPDKLDVDQWVCVARDAGMKYAILTAKHVAGHCLWPTRQTDYHVGNSGNRTDVVEAFVNACEKRGILPGLYYCSWDNHNKFGSFTPSDYMALPEAKPFRCCSEIRDFYTTQTYREFQMRQLEELLTGYGRIAEVWIDIPGMVSRDFRYEMYSQIAVWQPETVIMMNHGIGDGADFRTHYAWPTDLVAIERWLPNSQTGHQPWRTIEGQRYYLPGEVCDPIGREWFFTETDVPRPDEELLGMYLVARSRGANLLLDVPPDRSGRIPSHFTGSLARLRKQLDHLGCKL